MNPKNISIRDYTYHLPEEKISRYPLAERDASKLLIYKNGNLAADIYKNIDAHLPANSLVIFNDTKVIEARLLFQKSTGGIIEIFCLEPHEQYPDITCAMLQQEKVFWKCLLGGASKWKHGLILEKKIHIEDKEINIYARYVEKRSGYFIIELSWSPAKMNFAEVLHHAGGIPLPPYIKRDAEANDAERYQTIYAHHDGSVAAPTAGLHFTDAIFERLKRKKIQRGFVTLHVGAGTFQPVKAERMEQHEMHAEFMDVSKDIIESIISKLDNCIIAAGTTSLRTIESLYWLGVKVAMGIPKSDSLAAGNSNVLKLDQWEAYELAGHNISPVNALQSLVDWMNKNECNRLLAKTQIIIAPGYKTKIVQGLITNFHQPNSTLLLLVAALIGKDWRKVYSHALENDFRFLSYGDGCLLWIPPSPPTAGEL